MGGAPKGVDVAAKAAEKAARLARGAAALASALAAVHFKKDYKKGKQAMRMAFGAIISLNGPRLLLFL